MEFRKIFDSIPEQFDKWRPRYCDEAFSDIIQYAKLDTDKTVLEIGPGTGQATEPILKTGSSYLAIELGCRLARRLAEPLFTKSGGEICIQPPRFTHHAPPNRHRQSQIPVVST